MIIQTFPLELRTQAFVAMPHGANILAVRVADRVDSTSLDRLEVSAAVDPANVPMNYEFAVVLPETEFKPDYLLFIAVVKVQGQDAYVFRKVLFNETGEGSGA